MTQATIDERAAVVATMVGGRRQITGCTMSARKLLEAAIDSYGSEAKLGAAIGFSQNAVHAAKRRGTITPAMAACLEHVLGIDRKKWCPDRELVAGRVNGKRKRRG